MLTRSMEAISLQFDFALSKWDELPSLPGLGCLWERACNDKQLTRDRGLHPSQTLSPPRPEAAFDSFVHRLIVSVVWCRRFLLTTTSHSLHLLSSAVAIFYIFVLLFVACNSLCIDLWFFVLSPGLPWENHVRFWYAIRGNQYFLSEPHFGCIWSLFGNNGIIKAARNRNPPPCGCPPLCIVEIHWCRRWSCDASVMGSSPSISTHWLLLTCWS